MVGLLYYYWQMLRIWLQQYTRWLLLIMRDKKCLFLAKLLLTEMSLVVIPPPMSSHCVEMDSPINMVTFHPDCRRLALILSNGHLVIVNKIILDSGSSHFNFIRFVCTSCRKYRIVPRIWYHLMSGGGGGWKRNTFDEVTIMNCLFFVLVFVYFCFYSFRVDNLFLLDLCQFTWWKEDTLLVYDSGTEGIHEIIIVHEVNVGYTVITQWASHSIFRIKT